MNLFTNPYAPGAGNSPPALVGRDDLIGHTELALNRVLLGHHDKGLILTGLRGVGKTVLLNTMEDKAERLDIVSIFLEAPEDGSFIQKLGRELGAALVALERRGALSEKVSRAMRVFKSFSITAGIDGSLSFGVKIEPERGIADKNDTELDLRDVFLAIGDAAKDRNTALFLAIDELQYLSRADLSALVISAHRAVQRKLPIVIAGAGLPNLPALAGDAKTYAERLFEFREIGSLAERDVRRAIEEPAALQDVRFAEDALQAIIEKTQGYPYFVQEWAHDSWKIAPRSPISLEDVTHASQMVQDRLDRSFFRVRFDRLTPKEQQFLRAMAELGPGAHATGDVAKVAGGTSSTNISRLRDSLIRKGMIYAPDYGALAFTVPLFDQFMKRALPLQAIDAVADRAAPRLRPGH